MTEALTFEAWRRNRGTYIGGSDLAAIVAMNNRELSPYRNIGQVWNEKVRAQERAEAGDDTLDPEMETRFTRWGKRQESVILAEYADVTGFEVRAPGLQLFRHPEFPFIGGTIDGEATTPFGDLLTVEAKTTDAFYQARERIWGEQGTDQIPEWFVPQGMQYMIVRAHLGYDTRCDFVPLIGGNDFRMYHLQYNRELAEQLIEIQVWFWDLVKRRVPPPMDFSAPGATKLQRRIYDKIVGETKTLESGSAAHSRAVQLLMARDQAHAEAELWSAAKEKCTAELLSIAGNYGRVEIPVTVNGKTKVLAIKRQAKAGYHVDAYDVDPSISLYFEPHHLKKRKEIFDAIAEEAKQHEIEGGASDHANAIEGTDG